MPCRGRGRRSGAVSRPPSGPWEFPINHLGGAGSPVARAVRDLRADGRCRLPALLEAASAAHGPALRALRRADGMAGRSVSRVLGAAARLRVRPRSRRIRRSRKVGRQSVERAGAAKPGRARGGAGRRGPASPCRRGDRVRPARLRTRAQARASPGRAAGTKARTPLEPRPGTATGACAGDSPAARSSACGAPP